MAKQILKSVGRAGVNFPLEDVMTVQYLLNCVPVPHGGPPIELAIDGACGPKTVKAIEDFQSCWFSYVDGRVDPNGQTIAALRAYDPAPHQPLPPPGASDIKNAGNSPAGSKTGGAGGGTKMGGGAGNAGGGTKMGGGGSAGGSGTKMGGGGGNAGGGTKMGGGGSAGGSGTKMGGGDAGGSGTKMGGAGNKSGFGSKNF